MHQPLHCLDRVDEAFPTGDRGGNSFILKKYDGVDELHALWDTIIYENHASSPALPFTSSSWASFGTQTSAISSKYSFSDTDKHLINFY